MPKQFLMENVMENGILNSDTNNSIEDEAQPQGSRPESEGDRAEHLETHQTDTYDGGNG